MTYRFIASMLVAALSLAACQNPPAPAAAPAPAPPKPAAPNGLEDQNARAVRQMLLDELTPVTLSNCRFRRFGSPNDGGYVMCENLLGGIGAGYSYGIGGNDDWGCDVSRTYKVPVHQYDCFQPPTLSCRGGQFVPHSECVGPKSETVDGRVFDSISNQIARNGDSGKPLLVKIDVEGAEWDTLLATPDEILDRFVQIPMELHNTSEPRFLDVVQKLKRTFHLVHLHFNNDACTTVEAPFPATAYQVLWVNKRVGIVGPPEPGAVTARALDAPDNRVMPDCQLPASTLLR